MLYRKKLVQSFENEKLKLISDYTFSAHDIG